MTGGGVRRLGVPGPALAVLALGLAARLGVALTAPIWFDEATVGLMARDVLGGRFPFFFYGQTFMGAAEAYLHALVFAALGSSVEALRVWPVVASLVSVALVGLLTRRVFGRGRWAVLLALLPSPFLLKWSHDARLHYDLVLVLTPLLLLLGCAALDPARSPTRRTRALLVFAFLAGLGSWINLLLGLLPVALGVVLAVRRPRLRREAWALPVAWLLGSAPLWVFAAGRGRLPAATAPLAAGPALLRHARDLFTNALPLLVGVPPRALRGPFAALAVAGTLGLLALAIVGSLGDRRARPDGRLLLAVLVAVGLIAVVGTEQGGNLGTEDPRYLLPLLAILPVLLGGMVGRLARDGAATAGAVAVLLLTVHGAGLAAEYPALVSRAAWRARRAQGAVLRREADELAAAGLTALYTHDPDVLTFASGERVTVSHFYQDSDPERGRRVDGAPRVAYLSQAPPPGFDESLTAAGIRFSRHATPLGALYTDFALEAARYRGIPAVGWAATASHEAARAQHAVDRDAATRWDSRARQTRGMWFQLDLGRVYEIGMVSWLPGGFQEVPVGLRLETSADGVHWRVARDVPRYYGPLYWSGSHPMGRVRWGRVELRFPPRPARYLRITELGEDHRFPWTIRELFVYEALPPSPATVRDSAAAVAALRRAGARRVYADHGVGARLAALSGDTLAAQPADLQVDRYGTVPPPNALPRFAPGADAAIVYAASSASAGAIEATLRAAGWRFTTEEAGGYRLLTRFARAEPAGVPLASRGWRLSGVPEGADPRAAIDGQLGTRWSTRGPQRPGQQLQVDLPEPTTVVGVELDLGRFRFDYPRGLELQIARAPGAWEPVPARTVRVGPLVWAGTHLLRDGVDRVVLRFPATSARALRLIQTGGDPFFDWSVAELRLLGP